MTRVAIFGCGYVGRELGRNLLERGHEVLGLCRSDAGLEAVEAAGLSPVRGDVTHAQDLRGLPEADHVVFTASSGAGGATSARSVYVDGLRTVLDTISDWTEPPDRLLYTSSTGVYGDHDGGWVDVETTVDPATPKTEVLAEAEVVARGANARGIQPIVARLGGIYGPGRYRLDRYLDGPVREGYINLVHRTDIGRALQLLLDIDREAVPETVVVVDNEPAWKPDMAAWLAEQTGRAPPETQQRPDAAATERRRRGQKRCSNERLRSLGFEFRYPTYRKGYRAAIEKETE